MGGAPRDGPRCAACRGLAGEAFLSLPRGGGGGRATVVVGVVCTGAGAGEGLAPPVTIVVGAVDVGVAVPSGGATPAGGRAAGGREGGGGVVVTPASVPLCTTCVVGLSFFLGTVAPFIVVFWWSPTGEIAGGMVVTARMSSSPVVAAVLALVLIADLVGAASVVQSSGVLRFPRFVVIVSFAAGLA